MVHNIAIHVRSKIKSVVGVRTKHIHNPYKYIIRTNLVAGILIIGLSMVTIKCIAFAVRMFVTIFRKQPIRVASS